MRKRIAKRKLDMARIGKRLRTMIAEQHDSVGHFADCIGISRTSLYRIVSGESAPEAQTLADICARLGCSVDFLLGLTSPEMDSAEAYDEALVNIYAYRSEWTRAQQLYLVYASMGLLSEAEEKSLKVRLNLDCPEAISPRNPPG